MTLGLLVLSGCGISGASRPGDNSSDNDAASPTGQQVVIPVSGGGSAANDSIDHFVGGFFGDPTPVRPIIGPGQFDNFLSFLSDAFVSELLGDTPSSPGFQSSETYLERVCIDNGTPEHICRQRYGY